MAPSRARERLNDKWLNELCSADLLNEPRKKKRKSNSNMFVAERVISKRQGKKLRELICACTYGVSRKLRPRKLRPQTSDPENSDPEKSDPENSDPENSDPLQISYDEIQQTAKDKEQTKPLTN